MFRRYPLPVVNQALPLKNVDHLGQARLRFLLEPVDEIDEGQGADTPTARVSTLTAEDARLAASAFSA